MNQDNEKNEQANQPATAPTHELVSNADGIMELRFSQWHDFFSYVNLEMGRYDSIYIWRGQRDARWEILSSLGRHEGHDFYHLDNFREAIAGLTSTEFDIGAEDHEKAESERLKLWSLGQHFGLMTPLIDWTQFPFVALFFAFHEPDDPHDQSEHRAVYALSWSEVELLNFRILESGPKAMQYFRTNIEHPPFAEEFARELMDLYGQQLSESLQRELQEKRTLPRNVIQTLTRWRTSNLRGRQLHRHHAYSSENYRVSSQGGLFVYTPDNMSVEQWVRDNWSQADCPAPILRRFLVPTRDRKDILKALNRMRINYLSLFPDFEGASRYCNMALRERDASLSSIRAY